MAPPPQAKPGPAEIPASNAPASGHAAPAQPVQIHPPIERVEDIDPLPQPPARKKALRRVLMLGGVVIVLAGASFAYLTGGRYVGTEDAYVKAAQLNVTTDVSGMVKSIEVKEGQRVAAGDVLFRIDPEPFQIALDNAKASELQAEMTVSSLKADYRSAQQQVRAQQALVDVARTKLDSYEALAKQKLIARTEEDQQQAIYLSALATLNALQQAAVAALARLNGQPELPVDQFPDVMKARAAVAEATRQLDHAVVRAPFGGIVTAVSSLQPGTLIISAMSAFSTTSAVGLVSDKDLWIEAHMKETDLTRVHAGLPVDVKIDTYPDCDWHGSVNAVSAASGSAFSPLPSENISGNWVKVVQRISVRVNLDSASCNVPLSTGMSAEVSIDTGHSHWDDLAHS